MECGGDSGFIMLSPCVSCLVPTNPCSQAVDPCKKVNMQCQVVAAPLYRCGCTKGFRPNVLGTGCEGQIYLNVKPVAMCQYYVVLAAR